MKSGQIQAMLPGLALAAMCTSSVGAGVDRRAVVHAAAAAGIAGFAAPETRIGCASEAPAQLMYRCDTVRQQLVPQADLSSVLRADFVLCGEHHDSPLDHKIELELLQGMASAADADGRIPLTVGLECFERCKQSVLDEYIAGRLSDEQLYEASEWATRWVWSYESYLPILQFARERKIPLIAVNTDSEVVKRVPVEGYDCLTPSMRGALVPDGEGFAAATRAPYFGRYARNIIMSSYGVHVSQEFIDNRATAGNFFAARVLRDEAMASAAAKAVQSRGGRGLIIIGADHCKFDLGVSARLRRYAPAARVETVLLNPSPSDTLSPSEKALALTLGEESDAPPLADYVIFSKGGRYAVR